MNLLYLFLLILIIYIIVYGFVYPQFVKNNVRRFFIGDAIISIAIIILIGIRFWESGEAFDFFLFKSNWFVATLVCQLLAECILMYFYDKRYKIFKEVMGSQSSKED